MKSYLDLLRFVLSEGEQRTDRTGTGTLSVFGTQTRYDLREGFPLVTTKKVNFELVVRELLWFLSGSTNVNELVGAEQLWRPWADENGQLGPIYGHQWRQWGAGWESFRGAEIWNNGTDQISQALHLIKTYPDSRRIIVSAWNVKEIDDMALPPCHTLFQFYVSNGHLDLQLYQRSADLAIGVPFNTASYALLLSMFAKECRLTPRYFIHSIGDAHIYLNHVEGVREQLGRQPFPLPILSLSDKPVLEQRLEDISLKCYQHHSFIKFEVAV